MIQHTRLAAIVTGGIATVMLAACGTTQPMASYPSYPTTTVTTMPQSMPVSGVEYGRITNIEFMPAGTTRSGSGVLGAVVGGVAGALLGNTIGGGSGRAAATVLGGVAGAAIGSNIQRNNQGATMGPGYRITMATDQGYMRTFEVPATGDLTVGDRVRVDGGVIYRG